MSSAVVDQCVIVSGGQTDVHDITDTITLTLTLIGGHNGNEGKNSDTIYENPLTPAHAPNSELAAASKDVAWGRIGV